MRLPLRILLTGLMVIGLAACGFHLRSDDYRLPPPWQTLAIETGGNLGVRSELTRELSLQLRQRYGVTVQLGHTDKLPTIVLQEERFNSPVSALDTLGRAREYLLEYTVYYRLVDADGKELLPKQRIYLRQEQTYSSRTILASEQESQYRQQQLRRRAAEQIVERLLATVNQRQ